MVAGRKNAYTCGTCDMRIVTVDRVTGVTPMFLRCQSCGGRMVSSMYRVDQSETATHEWYAPKINRRMSPAEIQHYRNGGLALRAIRGTAGMGAER